MPTKILALATVQRMLSAAHNGSLLICLDPGVTQDEINRLKTSTDEADKKKFAGLWVADLFAPTPVAARRVGWGFFALVIDDVGWTQPVMVEEPDPDNPTQPKLGAVGQVAALIAVSSDNKTVFVKTVMANRPVATGKGWPKILELDRSSKSKDETFTGEPVGELGYANSARIRGAIQNLAAVAPAEAINVYDGWMPVEQFILESRDMLGKAALITALVEKGLVRFGP